MAQADRPKIHKIPSLPLWASYLGFGALFLLIMVGAGYSLKAYYDLRAKVERETLAANLALAEIGADLIGDHQRGVLDRLAAAAGRETLRRALAEGRTEALQDYLGPIIAPPRGLDCVFVAEVGGALILAHPCGAGELGSFRETLAGLPGGLVSGLRKAASGESFVLLAVPIPGPGGEPAGLLGVRQRPMLWREIFRRFSARPERSFFLFDQAGELITEGRADDDRFAALVAGARETGEQARRAGGTVARILSPDEAECQAMLAAAPVPGLGWSLVVAQDLRAALADTQALFDNILVFGSLLFCCLLMVGLLLTAIYRGKERLLGQSANQARRLEAEVDERTRDLAASIERYRSLVQDLPDIIYELDEGGRFRFVSNSVVQLLGYTPEEMLGHQRREFVLPEDRHLFDEERRRAESGEALSILALRHRHKEGGVRWLSIHSRGIFDDKGHLIGRRGVSRDVTRAILAETQIRQLSGELINAQEEERRRIAMDLHDEMGQLLSALKMGLQSLVRRVGVPERTDLEKLIQLVQRVVDGLRALAYRLRPAVLDRFGLRAAVEDLCETVAEASMVEVEQELCELAEERLSPQARTSLFRFVQEAVTNVVRHADSPRLLVAMFQEDGYLCISVRDFGHGFDPEEALSRGKHLGLWGMKERLSLVGGELNIESSAGGSWLLARVPLEPGA